MPEPSDPSVEANAAHAAAESVDSIDSGDLAPSGVRLQHENPDEAASGEDPAGALIGTTLAERYRIERLLGEGGMGAVYRATHVHMHKTVALKLLHAEMAVIPEALKRFEREAVAAARITHENIATALDFGQLPDGSFYLVMEYVPGEVLRNVLAAGAMPPERVVHIGVQIAAALSAAHAAGIVHRDLKPENVILTDKLGTRDHVKVLDLGIARVPMEQGSGPSLTRTGAVLGTPMYMAPEQGLGSRVDHRADLYALGVVLYEMAAGTPPFSDDDGAVAAITRHLTQAPPPLPAAVPAELGALILSLLEKRPDDRPQSGEQVVAGLHAALAAQQAAATAAAPVVESALLPDRDPPAPSRTRWRVAAVVATILLLSLAALGMSSPDDDVVTPEATPRTPAVATTPPAAAAKAKPPTTAAAPRSTSTASASPSESPPPSRATAAPRTAKPKKKAKPQKKERKTGPGGIYIPPPKDWF